MTPSRVPRRHFLGTCATAGFGGFASESRSAPRDQLPLLGKVPPRDSLSIQASPLSVGFETLDRKLFAPERTYPHLARLGVKWARVHTG